MPYEVRPSGSQFCVYKPGESEPVPGGCHDSMQEAEDHMSALYANEPNKAAGGAMRRKNFDVQVVEDGWIVASTSVVDRDKDRVFPGGLVLENYLKNPVLIFGHNYREPWAIIGRAKDVRVTDDLRILPELREPASDSDPMHIIRALWNQGLLKAASIGFNPIEAHENQFGGLDFMKAELLEVSLVPVPANQQALRLAVKAIKDAEPPADEPPPPAAEEPPADPEPEPDEEPEVEDTTEAQLAQVLSQFISNIREILQ